MTLSPDHIRIKDVAAVVGIFRDMDIPPSLRRKIELWAEINKCDSTTALVHLVELGLRVERRRRRRSQRLMRKLGLEEDE
jgi:hypothetical protein